MRRSQTLISSPGKQALHNVAREDAADIKRLANDRAVEELLIRDHFRGKRAKPEFEDFLRKGVSLEKAGRLLEACQQFERALALQPANLELRQYVSRLISEINNANVQERQLQAYQEYLKGSVRQKKSSMPWMKDPTQYEHVHGRKSMPPQRQELSREMADLERQAQEVCQRRERIKAEEALLQRKVVEVERMRLKLDRSMEGWQDYSR